MWLTDARRKGLTFYVSKEIIGKVSFENSTWFSGADERFYRGKGAFYAATHPKTFGLWMNYFVLRTKGKGDLTNAQKRAAIRKGREDYKRLK